MRCCSASFANFDEAALIHPANADDGIVVHFEVMALFEKNAFYESPLLGLMSSLE